MNVQVALPRTDRKWPAAVGAAALATGLTAAVFVFAVGTGSEKNASTIPAKPPLTASPALARSGQGSGPIISLTPARLAEGALGTGYALPSLPSGPKRETVLASTSPQTRAYTKAIMWLTFAQLAAGAAGHP